jgi:hypothetical protein
MTAKYALTHFSQCSQQVLESAISSEVASTQSNGVSLPVMPAYHTGSQDSFFLGKRQVC